MFKTILQKWASRGSIKLYWSWNDEPISTSEHYIIPYVFCSQEEIIYMNYSQSSEGFRPEASVSDYVRLMDMLKKKVLVTR